MGRPGIGENGRASAGPQFQQILHLELDPLEPGGRDVDRVHCLRQIDHQRQGRLVLDKGRLFPLPGRPCNSDGAKRDQDCHEVHRP